MSDKAPEFDVLYVLGRIEGKLDGVQSIVSNLQKDHENLESRFHEDYGALDERVRGVERRVWYATGIAAAIFAGAQAVLNFLPLT